MEKKRVLFLHTVFSGPVFEHSRFAGNAWAFICDGSAVECCGLELLYLYPCADFIIECSTGAFI